MRWFLTATVATVAALTLSAPTAAAEPEGCAAAVADEWCFFPAPADWEQAAGDFWSCPSCQSYGRQGVTQGRWSDYHCEGQVQGIDYVYDLYIPPGG
jgi:hypothetical protein